MPDFRDSAPKGAGSPASLKPFPVWLKEIRDFPAGDTSFEHFLERVKAVPCSVIHADPAELYQVLHSHNEKQLDSHAIGHRTYREILSQGSDTIRMLEEFAQLDREATVREIAAMNRAIAAEDDNINNLRIGRDDLARALPKQKKLCGDLELLLLKYNDFLAHLPAAPGRQK